jgi:putative acyl-CoA dehydrogenase
MPAEIDPVSNQSTPFVDRNLFEVDAALRCALRVHGGARGAAAERELLALGARLGEAEVQEWARLANTYGPVLHNFDRNGHRIDEVEFHPAWHALMRLLIGTGAHAEPWLAPGAGAQVVRAARYFLYSQVENGTQCPATMTYASVPALRQHAAPGLRDAWLPKVLALDYDPASKPAAAKRGLLLGMGMTERQGGSDVRTNTTRAERSAADDGSAGFGDAWRLTGHKWFFSAPQADAHLVLAQTETGSAAGLSCFFVPRWTSDGRRNAIRVQRLKDKVGNRSNASSEVEFEGAVGHLVGALGRGVPTILEMGNHTRMDCAIAAAGIMRTVLNHALHHARERQAFGRRLVDHGLMANVLADLALESEAATHLVLRMARAYDGASAGDDGVERNLARVLTPAAKYWVCKRLPAVTVEAMEVMGGNGYVEEGPFARFYREAPLNSIWEGSGNVICLDLLRVLGRQPAARHALAAELAAARGRDPHYDGYVDGLERDLAGGVDIDPRLGRAMAERVALSMQASLLLRDSDPEVAAAFCASRLAPYARGAAFGTLPATIDPRPILARALP